MFSPTIMLLIGGFTIAAALSKTNIDRVLITRVLSLAGTRPSVVLLAVMGVACFASMWIRCGDFRAPIVSKPRVLTLSSPFSNVAAPTLCFTLVRVRLNYCIFCFAFRTLTLLIAANLADSPTEGILWALPCREHSHRLFDSQLDLNCPSARDRAGRQHRRAIIPYFIATELNCVTSDGTPA